MDTDTDGHKEWIMGHQGREGMDGWTGEEESRVPSRSLIVTYAPRLATASNGG